jgi:hypothetical protein
MFYRELTRAERTMKEAMGIWLHLLTWRLQRYFGSLARGLQMLLGDDDGAVSSRTLARP